MQHGTLTRARGESVRVESVEPGVFRVHAGARIAREGAGGWSVDVDDTLRVDGEVRIVTAVRGSGAGWSVVETAPVPAPGAD